VREKKQAKNFVQSKKRIHRIKGFNFLDKKLEKYRIAKKIDLQNYNQVV